MSCPVCDHTMQNLGVNGQRIFWCKRCGTVKTESGDFSEYEMPIHLRHAVFAGGMDRLPIGSEQFYSVTVRYMVNRTHDTIKVEQEIVK